MKHKLYMKTIFYFLAAITFVLYSCQSNNKSISDSKNILGIWRLADIIHENKVETGDKLLNEAKKKEAVKQGMVYAFFSDGNFTVTAGEGNYSFGKWSLTKDNKLCLSRTSGNDTLEISYNELEDKKIQLKMLFPKSNESLIFIQEAKLLSDFKEDPFYTANNLWRIKPVESENINLIRERLGNYFKHIAYILKASEERKQEVVSFEFSMGIVKIYNGGIGINNFDIIPDTWKKTFFDNNEALIAHEMFRKYMENSEYRGASTGNWVKDDYDIMISIYGDLKGGKFIY